MVQRLSRTLKESIQAIGFAGKSWVIVVLEDSFTYRTKCNRVPNKASEELMFGRAVQAKLKAAHLSVPNDDPDHVEHGDRHQAAYPKSAAPIRPETFVRHKRPCVENVRQN
ncbi:hypothetical protein FGIG_01943 [Fasciola gigantica]|uniref:Uncharacterized protein n=1 Tax=Fasciola gigantica TaxID=46835 RepID=A0A504YHB7_FASGI|nr:hypothetical protein FGIG_01943 [Fasciola gigantica]